MCLDISINKVSFFLAGGGSANAHGCPLKSHSDRRKFIQGRATRDCAPKTMFSPTECACVFINQRQGPSGPSGGLGLNNLLGGDIGGGGLNDPLLGGLPGLSGGGGGLADLFPGVGAGSGLSDILGGGLLNLGGPTGGKLTLFKVNNRQRVLFHVFPT